MAARTSDKRERLLGAARRLIHRRGYARTTLADIAEASGVPLGNVYYYFKTKDDIAEAVIGEQVQELRASFAAWERDPDPRARLIAYADMIDGNREAVARYGCPMGSLCQELDKDRGALARCAERMLKLQLDWATKQFRLLGKRDAVDLAQQLVAALQGISLLANALASPALVQRQVRRLKAWLRTL